MNKRVDNYLWQCWQRGLGWSTHMLPLEHSHLLLQSSILRILLLPIPSTTLLPKTSGYSLSIFSHHSLASLFCFSYRRLSQIKTYRWGFRIRSMRRPHPHVPLLLTNYIMLSIISEPTNIIPKHALYVKKSKSINTSACNCILENNGF